MVAPWCECGDLLIYYIPVPPDCSTHFHKSGLGDKFPLGFKKSPTPKYKVAPYDSQMLIIHLLSLLWKNTNSNKKMYIPIFPRPPNQKKRIKQCGRLVVIRGRFICIVFVRTTGCGERGEKFFFGETHKKYVNLSRGVKISSPSRGVKISNFFCFFHFKSKKAKRLSVFAFSS
jgi:hypothetical protein